MTTKNAHRTVFVLAVILGLLIILASEAIAQEPPWCDARCKVSIAVYAGGSAFDLAASSMMPPGWIEGNPLARGKDKRFSPWKGALLKALPLGASLMMQKQHPRAMFWFRTVAGAEFIGAGVYGLTITHRW